jgi:hypothetical protein
MPALHFLIFTTRKPGAACRACALGWKIPTNSHYHCCKNDEKEIFLVNNKYGVRNTKVS